MKSSNKSGTEFIALWGNFKKSEDDANVTSQYFPTVAMGKVLYRIGGTRFFECSKFKLHSLQFHLETSQ